MKQYCTERRIKLTHISLIISSLCHSLFISFYYSFSLYIGFLVGLACSLSWNNAFTVFLSKKLFLLVILLGWPLHIKEFRGAPGWLSRLSVWLQLRSWSLWVWAPRWALCWELRAWRLLRILSVSLSFSAPALLVTLSLPLSKNKIKQTKRI